MTILAHTADWHFVVQGDKVDPETGLNARLMDRYRCARFVVEDAVIRGAELVVHCGDVGESWHPTPRIARLTKQAFAPALEAGVPVVAVKGNHDDPRNAAELHALDLLRDTPGITVVDQPCLLDVWRGHSGQLRVDPAATAEQRAKGDDTVLQLACLPYPNPQLLLRDEDTRKLSPGDRNLVIRQKMMDVARGLVAETADRLDDIPRLLLGHWSVDTAEVGSQNRLMMLGGEFALSIHELEALGFDAILLGHIHKAQILGYRAVYCGSPEACSFGEEGEEKGYGLWTLRPGHRPDWLHIDSPYRRLVTLEFPRDFTEEGELAAEAPVIEDAIVRLEIPAGSTLTVAEAQKAIEGAGAFEARVTTARAETKRRTRETAISQQTTREDALRTWLAQKPELSSLADPLVEEARRVEERAATEGGVR